MAKWEVFKSAEFNGDIVITDPCYLAHGGGKGVRGDGKIGGRKVSFESMPTSL